MLSSTFIINTGEIMAISRHRNGGSPYRVGIKRNRKPWHRACDFF